MPLTSMMMELGLEGGIPMPEAYDDTLFHVMSSSKCQINVMQININVNQCQSNQYQINIKSISNQYQAKQ
jgi:hypothetical protein